MESSTVFPTELDSIKDAPDLLRSALVEALQSEENIRLLVHAPCSPSDYGKYVSKAIESILVTEHLST